MDDMTGRFKSLSTVDKEEKPKVNPEPKPEVDSNTPEIISGKAYPVAGKYGAIKKIIGSYKSEIIGGFHKTIDEKQDEGICYIRKPTQNYEEMLKEFCKANILVWREKEVKQATNGYQLNLANDEHLKFAIANKDKIKFLGSPDINKESIYPAIISYTIPKGCYCTPDGDEPVRTPNKCAMGVKIDTLQDPKKTNNKQISKEDLDKILDHYQKKTVPKQESKEIKTEK